MRSTDPPENRPPDDPSDQPDDGSDPVDSVNSEAAPRSVPPAGPTGALLHPDPSDTTIDQSGSDDRTLHAVAADTVSSLVDAAAAADRMLATVSAWRARLVAEAHRLSVLEGERLAETDPRFTTERQVGMWDAGTVVWRELVSELACAMRVPERTAEALVSDSTALVAELPATLTALQDGTVSYRHAQTLVDHAMSLEPDLRAEFEQTVLPAAQRLTVAKFDRKARSLREKLDPTTITTRHTAAGETRRVELQPARDGMSWLHAFLPSTEAEGIYRRLCDAATRLNLPDESRTLTQLRVDVLADLLMDGVTPGGAANGIRPKVLITVPVMTLLGHSEEPAMLEGYGPIDPDTARRLAAKAPSFTRLLTHPVTGVVMSVGRERYKVPKALRTYLRVRDETCRFPGCNRAATGCEMDHIVAWAGQGETGWDNLEHLCKKHHKMKHETRWAVTHHRDGTLTWQSPSAKKYITYPATEMHPPDQPRT